MHATTHAIGAIALASIVAGCTADKAVSNAADTQAADEPQAAPSCRRDYLAAGILPYTIRDGRVALLLGEESRTEGLVWTDFIGTRKDPDCDPVVTAAREFREETRGAYPEAATLEYVRDRAPLVIDPPGVYFWIMPVDYIAPDDLAGGPIGRWSEKFKYCWVDLATLLRGVDEDGPRIPAACDGRSEILYTKFEKNLRPGGASRDALEELLARHAGP